MKLNIGKGAVLMTCLQLLFLVPKSAFCATQHVTACATAITTSGVWVVDNDLTCSSGAISVEVSNVTLKLQGHTITGNGTSFGVTVSAGSGAGVKNAIILGPGTITNFTAGVVLLGTVGGGIVDVSVTQSGNGIYLTTDANGVKSSGLLIAQNTAVSDAWGIACNGVTKSVIVGNNVSSGSVGISFTSVTSSSILGNITISNGAHGIEVQTGSSSNIVEGNTSNNNSGSGIYLAPGTSASHMSGNVASGNGLDINEGNASCNTDTYKSDVFNTSNQACVK